MSLCTRLLAIGIGFLLLQIATIAGLFYSQTLPVADRLEKTTVETNLHRNLEILQRELFHLEHLTQLLAHQPLIAQLINSPVAAINQTEFQKEMLVLELNLMAILNKQNKVLWENLLDLTTEQPYPKHSILTSLWETKPTFFEHFSRFSLQAGFYNTSLGPLLIVSAPIVEKDNSISGTLIVGKFITTEVIQLLQSMTVTDLKLWPQAEAKLNDKQLSIVNQILASDSDFLIEPNQNLLRGYMILSDLNAQPKILISTTQSKDISHLLETHLAKMLAILLLIQGVWVIIFISLSQRRVITPLYQLTKQCKNMSLSAPSFTEIHSAGPEISHLIIRLNQFLQRQQTFWTQQINSTIQAGSQETQQYLEKELGEILSPLLLGLKSTEQKLSSLPINDIEWIIAQSKTGQINEQIFEEMMIKLGTINEQLKSYQKEARQSVYELYTKLGRNAAALRLRLRLSASAQENKRKWRKNSADLTRS